jgi:hypothetical protein
MIESVRIPGMAIAAAGGLAALALLATTRIFFHKSAKEEDCEKLEIIAADISTGPSSAVGSPARSSPVPQTVPGDLLFFSILDSYNRTTPGLSSSASGTPSPAGKRKKRNRRNSKKRIANS